MTEDGGQRPGRIPNGSAAAILDLLNNLKAVAAPYKRPSVKKMASDAAIFAARNSTMVGMRLFM